MESLEMVKKVQFSFPIDLFILYILFFHFRPRGALMGIFLLFFFQAEDGIRDVERSRGLGDVYKRQVST